MLSGMVLLRALEEEVFMKVFASPGGNQMIQAKGSDQRGWLDISHLSMTLEVSWLIPMMPNTKYLSLVYQSP